MKRIAIGLTSSSLLQLLEYPYEYSDASTMLKQHTLVFSDTLLTEYEKIFESREMTDVFRQWFQGQQRIDGRIEHDDSQSDDFNHEIVSLLNARDHAILIKYREADFGGTYQFSVLKLDEINQLGTDNELSRQCIPTNFFLRKGSSKDEFCRWLRELLADEKKITIVDRYILSVNSKGILQKVYIPCFPANAKVVVHFGDDESDQAELSALKQALGKRITLKKSRSNEFHDRYIIGDSLVISIGVGLDVFDCNTNYSRKETKISLSAHEKPTIPSGV